MYVCMYVFCLLFINSHKFQAKIASIPISPALVLGFSFILGFVLYLVLGIDNDSFLWAPWL